MKSRYRLLFLLLLGVFIFCLGFLSIRYFLRTGKKASTLFELVSRDSSGIDFENKITTSDSLNIFSFEYIYNGGGVGIGDFNGDGLPDIFFGGNKLPGKLYINQGHFHFKDITSSSKINTAGSWSFG